MVVVSSLHADGPPDEFICHLLRYVIIVISLNFLESQRTRQLLVFDLLHSGQLRKARDGHETTLPVQAKSFGCRVDRAAGLSNIRLPHFLVHPYLLDKAVGPSAISRTFVQSNRCRPRHPPLSIIGVKLVAVARVHGVLLRPVLQLADLAVFNELALQLVLRLEIDFAYFLNNC